VVRHHLPHRSADILVRLSAKREYRQTCSRKEHSVLLHAGGQDAAFRLSLQFEPILQSGNHHLELAWLNHGFIVSANEGEIVRPQFEG